MLYPQSIAIIANLTPFRPFIRCKIDNFTLFQYLFLNVFHNFQLFCIWQIIIDLWNIQFSKNMCVDIVVMRFLW